MSSTRANASRSSRRGAASSLPQPPPPPRASSPFRPLPTLAPAPSHPQALAHPYLASLHDPSDEPLAHAAFSFEFESIPLSKPLLRELIAREMLAYHPDCGWDPAAASNPPPPPPPAASEAATSAAEVPTLPGEPPPPIASDAAVDSEPMQFD